MERDESQLHDESPKVIAPHRKNVAKVASAMIRSLAQKWKAITAEVAHSIDTRGVEEMEGIEL